MREMPWECGRAMFMLPHRIGATWLRVGELLSVCEGLRGLLQLQDSAGRICLATRRQSPKGLRDCEGLKSGREAHVAFTSLSLSLRSVPERTRAGQYHSATTSTVALWGARARAAPCAVALPVSRIMMPEVARVCRTSVSHEFMQG